MLRLSGYSLSIVLFLAALPTATAQTEAHWTAGTGNWTTVANWSSNPNYPNNGTPAGATYNAFLDGLNGNVNYTVSLNTAVAVNALTINSTRATLSHTAGIFQTTTGTISAGTYLLNGGTIQGGTWSFTGTGAMRFGSSRANLLDGVTVATTTGLDFSTSGSYVRLLNNTTLAAGTALSIGSGTLGLTQAGLAGVTVTMAFDGKVALEGNTTTTLAPSVTVIQAVGPGSVGSSRSVAGTGNLINQGIFQATIQGVTLNVDPSGTFTNTGTLQVGGGTGSSTLTVNPGGLGVAAGNPSWSNTGTVTIGSGGTFNIGGRVTTAGLNMSGINRTGTGGTISITGVLDNTGGTLPLSSATGPYVLGNGGMIVGGSITTAPGSGASLKVTNSGFQTQILSGVSLGLDSATNASVLDLSVGNTYVRFTNGTSFAPGSIATVRGVLALDQTQPLDNVTMTVVSGGIEAEAASTASIGPGATISISGSFGRLGGSGNFFNQGVFQVLTPFATGRILLFPGGVFKNAGTIRAGASSALVDIIEGTIFLNLPEGTIAATSGGTVTINPHPTFAPMSPNWTNQGTMTVNDGTLNLGGKMTTAGLGLAGLVRSGGTVNIIGQLDNTAATLPLTAATGGFRLNGGSITGGTVSTAAGSGAYLSVSSSSSNLLSGVALGSDPSTGASALDLSEPLAYVRLTNGTSFTSLGSVIVGTGGALGIAQTQPLDHAYIILQSSSVVAVEGSITATLGPSFTITQPANSTGRVGQSFLVTGVGNLVNQGTIQANAAGAVIDVGPVGSITHTGTLLAGAGGTINLAPITTLTNLSGGTLTGGTYVVQGNSTLNFFTRTVSSIGVGTTVTLDGAGSVFAAVNSVTANAGTFNLLNGRAFTVAGGTLTNTGTLQVGTGANLTGHVNSAGGTVSGAGTVSGNVTFTGTGNALRPGTSPGNLTVAGNLTLNAGTTVHAELNGPTPGTQHDRITVTGAGNTVTLGGATLNLTLGYDPGVNDKLFIIDNQTSNATTGTFANLPASGSTIQVTNPATGQLFLGTIFYAADTTSANLTGGNDVVMQFVPVPEPVSLLAASVIGIGLWRGRLRKM